MDWQMQLMLDIAIIVLVFPLTLPIWMLAGAIYKDWRDRRRRK